jgi:mevalonate kinase
MAENAAVPARERTFIVDANVLFNTMVRTADTLGRMEQKQDEHGRTLTDIQERLASLESSRNEVRTLRNAATQLTAAALKLIGAGTGIAAFWALAERLRHK